MAVRFFCFFWLLDFFAGAVDAGAAVAAAAAAAEAEAEAEAATEAAARSADRYPKLAEALKLAGRGFGGAAESTSSSHAGRA